VRLEVRDNHLTRGDERDRARENPTAINAPPKTSMRPARPICDISSAG
jgi:hypothetical protein